ncbi:MAG: C25 family cysteine peptidase, partial [Cyclobacteriaceae bacterium]|nr:C25 family cysteine peptidase [Cyclobacteriaceae bacterium]
IGLITTSRPVFSSNNFLINKAFFSALKEEIETNGEGRLGDIFRVTKNNSLSGISNRNFTLLGDPSMKLAMPGYRTTIDQINFKNVGLDTLEALSLATFSGSVVNGMGSINTGFNGELELVMYDKQNLNQTLGNENLPFNYHSWNTTLFRGKATVLNGLFEVSFVLPKNINYTAGEGRVSMYAESFNNQLDAASVTNKIVIGGSSKITLEDNIPPSIEIYVGDLSFISGSIVRSDTELLVHLKDESGINISNLGIGQDIVAVFDQKDIILNEYYTASADTYKEGWVHYELKNLQPGEYNLRVNAWDTHNNMGTNAVSLVVVDDKNLVIRDIIIAPNPVIDIATIYMEHNKSGDNLDIEMEIVDREGRRVYYDKLSIINSEGRINLGEWNGRDGYGEKLSEGLYLIRLKVYSTTDLTKNQKIEKILLVN